MSECAMDILFEGTKYFGNTKTLFHIALVEHAHYDVVEVVTYDKRHSVEAPRLYLIYSALLLRIDGSMVSQRIFDLKEEAQERDIPADEPKIVKIAVGEALFEFLASRLFASEASTNRAKLEFRLLQKDPVSASVRNPLCSKPDQLEPFSYASMPISVGKGLSAKEKWRIPIVLAKVAKGRTLNRRDSKIWDAYEGLIAGGDMDTLGSVPFSTATMATSDANSLGGFSASSKSQRWTHSQRPFVAPAPFVDGTKPTQDAGLLQQPKARRKSSFSAGYDAILSSLQRGLSMMSGTSIKSPKVTAPGASRASGTRDADATSFTQAGSAKLYSAASVGSVASFDAEGSRKLSSRQAPGVHGTTMMSRALSRRMTELAREAGASAKINPEPEVDPLEGLSPCDRANRELRAARYMAKLAASTAAAALQTEESTSIMRGGATTSTVVVTPMHDTRSAPSSPSARLQPSTASGKLNFGMTALLNPVLRLIESVTRRSISAVAPEG